MEEKLTKKFDGFNERKIHMAIVLDKRSNKKGITKYPVAARFSYDTHLYYKAIGGEFSEKEFSDICNTGKSGSKYYVIQKRWKEAIEKYSDLLVNLCPGYDLTLDMVKNAIEGKPVRVFTDDGKEMSFLSIWKSLINELLRSSRYSTGENYKRGYDSFVESCGKIEGFNITQDVIEKWEKDMRTKPCKTGRPLSEATIGMYMRSLRLAWKEAQRLGFMKDKEYPFSNKYGDKKVAIPRGGNRKDHYLDVEQMTQLYKFFVANKYPTTWDRDYAKRAQYSLGLFLAQYLCNGFNLADAGELTYDDFYFNSKRKQFRFERVKTAGRSSDGAEVIIPIIEPLQYILEQIVAPPVKGARVFPHILKNVKTPKQIRKRLSRENSNIKDRIHKITKELLGWEIDVSSTWARHSFATNLRNAGVDMQYIGDAMGHSQGKDVTMIYMAAYSQSQQFNYNKKLLSIRYSDDIDELENMSKEELQKRMKQMEAEMARLNEKLKE